jgi:hypothetical protein
VTSYAFVDDHWLPTIAIFSGLVLASGLNHHHFTRCSTPMQCTVQITLVRVADVVSVMPYSSASIVPYRNYFYAQRISQLNPKSSYRLQDFHPFEEIFPLATQLPEGFRCKLVRKVRILFRHCWDTIATTISHSASLSTHEVGNDRLRGPRHVVAPKGHRTLLAWSQQWGISQLHLDARLGKDTPKRLLRSTLESGLCSHSNMELFPFSVRV